MGADQDWMTVAEVADRLRVDDVTVRRWIRGKLLPALDLGSAKAGYRVARADLEAFIRSRYSHPHPPGGADGADR
jgi:excisionase family DNA binding protein